MSKEERLIEKLKDQIRIKKAKAIKKTYTSGKDNYTSKNIIVLKIGGTLYDKIEEDAENLETSRQKIIENILLKHYGLLRRK